jgi:hypothetical protein
MTVTRPAGVDGEETFRTVNPADSNALNKGAANCWLWESLVPSKMSSFASIVNCTEAGECPNGMPTPLMIPNPANTIIKPCANCLDSASSDAAKSTLPVSEGTCGLIAFARDCNFSDDKNLGVFSFSNASSAFAARSCILANSCFKYSSLIPDVRIDTHVAITPIIRESTRTASAISCQNSADSLGISRNGNNIRFFKFFDWVLVPLLFIITVKGATQLKLKS